MQFVSLNRLGLGTRSGSCAEALQWFGAVTVAGGSVSGARRVAVNRLIVTLQAAGIWPLLDRLWLHAAENATQALIDLKARATATAVNSPTFTVDRGYAGNGTSSYLNLGLAANAAGINFSRDGASFGGWILGFTGGGGVDFGFDYGGYSMLIALASSTQVRFEINSGTNPSGVPTVGTFTAGLYHGQRTGASVSALYRNGSSIITSTAPSVALQAKNFGAGAYVAGPASFSTGQYGASFIGASLSGKEVAFSNAMRTYMTGVGVP